MTMIDDPPITDEELTALALATTDDEVEIDADAVPWSLAADADGPLPSWYMPAPSATRRGWKTKAVAALIIGAFVLINACGLCITYGHLVVA